MTFRGTTDLPATLCTFCSNAERHLQRLAEVRQTAVTSNLGDRYMPTDLGVVTQAHQSLKDWVEHLRSLPKTELAEDHIAKHVTANALLHRHAARVLLQVLPFEDQVIADTIAFAITKTHTGATTDIERLWKLWEAVELLRGFR